MLKRDSSEENPWRVGPNSRTIVQITRWAWRVKKLLFKIFKCMKGKWARSGVCIARHCKVNFFAFIHHVTSPKFFWCSFYSLLMT